MKKVIEIVFVFFVSLTFTNCESSDCVEILQAESTCSNLPYLEFVVPMSKEDNFRNAEIMKEANNRVRPYLKIEDGHIELMLKSGKEINVSDEIFQIFVEGTKRNNTLLMDVCIFIPLLVEVSHVLKNLCRKQTMTIIIQKERNCQVEGGLRLLCVEMKMQL